MSVVWNRRFQILTANGFQPFSGIRRQEKSTIVLLFDDGSTLDATADHLLLTFDGFKPVIDLEIGESVVGPDGSVKRIEGKLTGKFQYVYDPINVEGDSYLSNEVVSHNCSFAGSANTLIPPEKLQILANLVREPIETHLEGNFKIYTNPVHMTEDTPAHTYLVTVDVSAGQGLDSSVINVFDVSCNPFKQVAVYRNNKITPAKLAPIVQEIGLFYNNAYVLVEINMEGVIVGDLLSGELLYENLVQTYPHPKLGQKIVMGGWTGNAKSKPGLRVVEATKRVGCSGLKALVETDKLVLVDHQTHWELSRYVSVNGSYEGDGGCSDDCVATLVLLGWVTMQPNFETYLGISMRGLLIQDQKKIGLELPLTGFFDTSILWQPEVEGRSLSGFEVVHDPSFWNEDEDDNWLR